MGYFVQGQFHLPTTQSSLWRQGIKLEVLLGFANFQITIWKFSKPNSTSSSMPCLHKELWVGCQFLEKYRIFPFGQFLMHQKTFQGINSLICYFQTHFQVHFQNIYSFIRLQAFSHKLCRFKNLNKFEIFAVFAFLPFLTPLEKQ